MAGSGWVSVHRKLLDWAFAGDVYYMALWVRLLLMATHKPMKKLFGSEVVELQPGQLISSRCALAAATGCNEHKVDRMLRRLETEQQIEQRMSSISRLITITNWDKYQNCEQRNEQRVSSECAASEQRVSTNNNKTIRQRTKTPVQEPAEFVLFWERYPRKIGKRAALAAWLKENPDIQKVTEALAWQVRTKDWVKDGGQFIPHPSTYIHQHRWEDVRGVSVGSVEVGNAEDIYGAGAAGA